jgi:hypothetical protein
MRSFLLLCAGLATGCLTSGGGPSTATADGGSRGGVAGADAAGPGAGLPLCPSFNGLGEAGLYASDPRNQLVIESGCAPLEFSGTGRVRRIERSAGSLGGIRLISVLLDTPGTCEGDFPAQISIVSSAIDWGLQEGSEVRVDLIGNRTPYINWGGGGALVRRPDGSLLAAFFDREGEEYITSFLARLPIAAAFDSECRDVGNPSGCSPPAIRKSMSLPGSLRLQEHQTTTISIAGAPFHVGLSTARDRLGVARCDDPAPLGPTYRLLLWRLPQP